MAVDFENISFAEDFDEIDIAANAFFFFLAGSDSTPMTLSCCLYELALNQEIQEKLHSEILKIQDKDKIFNYDSLKKMTYLDAVIAGKLNKLITVCKSKISQVKYIPVDLIRSNYLPTEINTYVSFLKICYRKDE